MREAKCFERYETPEIEVTRFEWKANLMDELTTHPNEGNGESITYASESQTHENGDIDWPIVG